MFRSCRSSNMMSCVGPWCCAAALVVGLGLAGCHNLSLYREEGFRDLKTSDYVRQVRPTDPKNNFFGASNKAREIEQDLGVGPKK